MAILDDLEDTGRLTLRPADPAELARMRAVVQAIVCDIHPVCNLRVAAHVEGLTGRGDTRAAWMRRFIRSGLETVEQMLDPTGPFAFCDRLTQADLVLIPQLYNAVRWRVSAQDLPRMTRVARACARLAACVRAYPDVVRAGAATWEAPRLFIADERLAQRTHGVMDSAGLADLIQAPLAQRPLPAIRTRDMAAFVRIGCGGSL
ncbi:hypothetical protein [Pseudooceanicola sp.]|uniref:hypothetical protein n=1 Tax=Pseudooceanicola sp. TaxID=1914328 RepID=UPI002620D836|nr:hypothetical protein [Pseudooceanicola sp.]MDF1855725.1 hypothetical protein [Pseudooceanicola sp.]